jgi:hypothetical protein
MRWGTFLTAATAFLPAIATAQEAANETVRYSVGTGGASGLWVLANLSYAGMRAQDSPRSGWRIIAFIFGFPGTLLTLLAVREGAERAYGVELPRHYT